MEAIERSKPGILARRGGGPIMVFACIFLIVTGITFKCPAQRMVSFQEIDTLRLTVPKDSLPFYDSVHPDVIWDGGRIVWYEFDHRRLWHFFPDGRLDRLAFHAPWPKRSLVSRLFAPSAYRYKTLYEPWRMLSLPSGNVVVSWGLFAHDHQGHLRLNQKLKHSWHFERRTYSQDSYGDRDPAWIDPSGEIITVPVRSMRMDKVWPTQDTVFEFGMLRFRVASVGKRWRAKLDSYTKVADTTHHFVDRLDNAVVDWKYCSDGQGGIFLGHSETARIWHVSGEGQVVAKFGMPIPPPSFEPFEVKETLPVRMLMFNYDTTKVTMAKISRMALEHHQYVELAFDSSSGLLFRMIRMAMPDSSVQFDNQKLRRPIAAQVYDTRDQFKYLGVFPLPTNTYLLGVDGGMLLLRQRETTDNLGIKIWRYRIEVEK